MSFRLDLSAFQHVASMHLDADGNGVRVQIDDADAGKLTEVVYVWVAQDDTAIRVGTTKWDVRSRLLQYARHITRSLAGLPSPTPNWEALRWQEILSSAPLRAFVHQPPVIDAVCGPLRPYLDIERALIKQLGPALNRSHR